jgi:hypothetical protein
MCFKLTVIGLKLTATALIIETIRRDCCISRRSNLCNLATVATFTGFAAILAIELPALNLVSKISATSKVRSGSMDDGQEDNKESRNEELHDDALKNLNESLERDESEKSVRMT